MLAALFLNRSGAKCLNVLEWIVFTAGPGCLVVRIAGCGLAGPSSNLGPDPKVLKERKLLIMVMKVFVGSTNPVKVSAVKKAFTKFFDSVEVVIVDAESGVSEQPMSDEEAIRGAVSRAVDAYEKKGFGVGLEGGIVKVQTVYYVKGWVAVTNGDKISLASTVSMPLPNQVVKRVIQGKSLGEVVDEMEGRKGVGEEEGIVGVLTNNSVTRSEFFEQALKCALAPFYNSEAYKGGYGR